MCNLVVSWEHFVILLKHLFMTSAPALEMKLALIFLPKWFLNGRFWLLFLYFRSPSIAVRMHKICQGLDSNCGPLVLERTALRTKLHPRYNLSNVSWIIKLFIYYSLPPSSLKYLSTVMKIFIIIPIKCAEFASIVIRESIARISIGWIKTQRIIDL